MSPGPDPRSVDQAAGRDPLTVALWVLAAALLVAVIGVLLLKSWPLLYPQISERAPLNPSCDLLQQACSLSFASGGEVRLTIRPRGIPPAHPLELEVRLEGLPAPQRVEIDFRGVDMDMGFNRTELEPQQGARPDPAEDAVAGSRWAGTGMLPVCVRDRMTWEAQVLLHYPQRLLAAPFRFLSQR